MANITEQNANEIGKTESTHEIYPDNTAEGLRSQRAELFPRKAKQQTWIGRSFIDRESAERAFQVLQERGYETQEINLLMSKETREKYFSDETEESLLRDKAQEGLKEKVTQGTLKGIVIGTLLTAGANIFLPGVGLFFGGPLFIGLGALSGGLGAALAESGIPEEQALAYESDVKAGRIVMGVVPQSSEDAEFLEREWKEL